MQVVLSTQTYVHRVILAVKPGFHLVVMGPTGVGLSRRLLANRVMLIADISRFDSACLYYKHYVGLSSGVDFYVQSHAGAHKLADFCRA